MSKQQKGKWGNLYVSLVVANRVYGDKNKRIYVFYMLRPRHYCSQRVRYSTLFRRLSRKENQSFLRLIGKLSETSVYYSIYRDRPENRVAKSVRKWLWIASITFFLFSFFLFIRIELHLSAATDSYFIPSSASRKEAFQINQQKYTIRIEYTKDFAGHKWNGRMSEEINWLKMRILLKREDENCRRHRRRWIVCVC